LERGNVAGRLAAIRYDFIDRGACKLCQRSLGRFGQTFQRNVGLGICRKGCQQEQDSVFHHAILVQKYLFRRERQTDTTFFLQVFGNEGFCVHFLCVTLPAFSNGALPREGWEQGAAHRGQPDTAVESGP